ncbi:MAG TPA: AAA family ATPase [Gemmatimonadaceae bacterium]|jgi:hypothetical protein
MSHIRQSVNFDAHYHRKIDGAPIADWSEMLQRIELAFHDHVGDPRADPAIGRKTFYLRSAYRHEPDFTANSLNRADDILLDSRRAPTLISGEARVSDNYQRIVADSVAQLFNPDMQQVTAGAITQRIVGRVREAMARVFDDLYLDGPGRPMQDGTFFFTKGTSRGYHYKNLSGGEKAAFDLLLDFILKSEVFNNTIYCIDEPELHMHTRLQGKLLDELLRQLPANCQLWMATHSIGMTRRAMEIHRAEPERVTFLDVTGKNFDASAVLAPARVDRPFWKAMFAVALDDLAGLVGPSEIVFCEGRREGNGRTRTPTFDAAIYRTVFSISHPDTEFIPLGGTNEVERDAVLLSTVIPQMLPAVKTWRLFDRDDRSPTEIAELEARGTRVLQRRDLESYLWDDGVLTALASWAGAADEAPALLAEKGRLMSTLPGAGKPADDIKAISGPLYNECKQRLNLTACGNNAIEFAKATLAPLIVPGMPIYAELEQAVFGAPAT